MTPAQLSRLYVRCFPNARPWSAEEFQNLINAPNTVLLTNDTAFLLAQISGDEAEILNLAVDPDRQRQGLASTLLHQLHTQLAAEQVMQVFLEVSADNTPAIALYSHAGYLPAGTRANYYNRADETKADALILRKSL